MTLPIIAPVLSQITTSQCIPLSCSSSHASFAWRSSSVMQQGSCSSCFSACQRCLASFSAWLRFCIRSCFLAYRSHFLLCSSSLRSGYLCREFLRNSCFSWMRLGLLFFFPSPGSKARFLVDRFPVRRFFPLWWGLWCFIDLFFMYVFSSVVLISLDARMAFSALTKRSLRCALRSAVRVSREGSFVHVQHRLCTLCIYISTPHYINVQMGHPQNMSPMDQNVLRTL